MLAPPKFSFIVTDLSGGGAQTALFRLVTSSELGPFSPQVISLREEGAFGDRLRSSGIPVSTIGMRPGYPPGPGAIRRLRRVVRTVQPALIQGWMYHGNLAASFVASTMTGYRPKVLWSIRHALHDPKSDSCATRAIIRLGGVLGRFPEGIIFNSESSAEQHFRLGYPKSKSIVIPNGLNMEGFGPNEAIKFEWRSRLEIPSTAVVIGTLARYHPTKDFPTMIRSLAELLRVREGHQPEVYGVFAGEGVTEQNQELMQLARDHGIERSVRFVGRVEDPRGILPAFDIGLLASRSEAFPNFILEAMASALPVVVTDVGDCRTLVGDCGLVCTPGDVAQIAAALNSLVEEPANRITRGEEGRSRVVMHYSLGSISASYASYYRQILES